MSIVVRCPDCRKEWPVKDELAGQVVNCPACRHPMGVPAPDGAVPFVPACRSRGPGASALVAYLVLAAFLFAGAVRQDHAGGRRAYGFPFRCVSEEGAFVFLVGFAKTAPDGRIVMLEGDEYLGAYERRFGYRPRPTWKVDGAALAGNVLVAGASAAATVFLCRLVLRRREQPG